MSSLIPPLSISSRPFPTRVVVRLLPPTLLEDEFVTAIESVFPDHSKIISRIFVPGRRDANPTPEEPNLNARCYLSFSTHLLACDFIKKFHGFIFTDDKEVSFRAVAAFAPFQKTSEKEDTNSLRNTIESDLHYLEFVASLATPIPSVITPTTPTSDAPYVSALVRSLTEKNSSRIFEFIKKPTSARSKTKSSKEDTTLPKPKAAKNPKSKDPKKETAPKKVTLLKRP